MSKLNATRPTLLDFAQSLGPDDKVATIVEILNETNEILEDMVFLEGNLTTGHVSVIRTGLPSPTWRSLYGGVQPSKSRRAKITDNTGMLESYAEQDKALVELNGNAAAFRLSEDRAHIEAMSQEQASTLIYGDETTSPSKFTGLAPRFNSLSAENAANIINAGGSGSDNSSIWLIAWGPNTCHGIYPQGSKAGISHTDKGIVTIENIDGDNGRMEAYRSHYKWDCGLVLRDWRYVVRIANIDVSDLTVDASGDSADLVELMIEAIEKLPSQTLGRPVFYMNQTIRTKLRQQIRNGVSGSTLSVENIAGKRVTFFDETPVRKVDAILNTEATVS